MQIFRRLVAILLWSSVLATVAVANPSLINWHEGDLPSALEVAKTRNVPVMIVFYMSWCGPSQYLLQTTFADEALAKYINESTVPLKLDGDVHPELFRTFSVYSYPTTVMLRGSGEEIDRYFGAGPAGEMMPEYKAIIESGKTISELLGMLERDPNNEELKYEATMKFARRNLVERAVEWKDIIEREHPDYYTRVEQSIVFAIGDAFFSLKRYDEAISYFDHLAQKFNEAKAYRFMAQSYYRSGRADQALTTLENAVAKLPSNIELYYDHLNLAWHTKLHLGEALSIAEQARRLDLPNTEKASICFVEAHIHKYLGDTVRAREMIDEAIRLDPRDEYIKFRDELLAGG